jgi:uncharacterized protein YbjT (DUF2867 family)
MQSPKKIAVAGATGRVGHHVVDVLRARGYDVVPMSRSQGVDVITGDGLAAALAGVGCVIDTATGQEAGVQRMVVVSIIGTDRFTHGYGAAKVAHEQAMLAGPIPALVLRASQFYEFIPLIMEWGTQGDVAYVPRMRTQPVAARVVAEVLADLATAPGSRPSGPPFPEVAGPREESLVEMATLFAERRGYPAKVEGVTDPADPDGLNESGGLLPGPDAILAGPTFEEWLNAT